ncbi:MAG TPA: DUF4259 domain-containing protein [Planctomycetota bacterium]|nr:DUF4259 domain-containing protein [Planctomycetota bacterium]
MGTWEVSCFENDDAMDWVYGLEGVSNNSIIAKALDTVVSSKEAYLEAHDCAVALAAAEVVAALKSRPSEDIPEEVSSWVTGKPVPDAVLVSKAVRAIDRIMTNSELKDLWAESDELSQWQDCLNDLKSRLK